MLTIAGKALGRKKPLFADFSVPVPPRFATGGDSATLRDLIEYIVRMEVDGFRQRQDDRKLLKVLSRGQIESALETGKVELGGQTLHQVVDADEAVANALLAFEDGLFITVLDEVERKSLDAQIYLQDDSRLTFIRLVMLAGG